MNATTHTEPLVELAVQGVSLWLDDLSRQRLTTGNLLEIIDTKRIVAVTTNPSLRRRPVGRVLRTTHRGPRRPGASVDAAVRELTTDHVRAAADLFAGGYHRCGGVDGRVSIEVDPRLAQNAAATIEQAKDPFKSVDRNNVLFKIPATLAGLPRSPHSSARPRSPTQGWPTGSRSRPRGNTIDGTYEESAAVFADPQAAGIDLENVYEVLETEGVQKFEQAWIQLLSSVTATLEQAGSA